MEDSEVQHHHNFSRRDSIEFKDAVIDEKWTQTVLNRNSDAPAKKEEESRGWFGRSGKSEEEKLLDRVEQHEMEELQTFIAQKLFRVDGIICDEQTRILLIEKMMNFGEYPSLDHDELSYRYGSAMAGWLRDRLVPSMSDCSSVLQRAASEFYLNKRNDPLCNWGHMNPEQVSMIVNRISQFTEEMSSKVKWSLLAEPGNITCLLTEFVQEFNRLENMFITNDLSPEEMAQTAFKANYLTKARSKLIPCVDFTRVRLNDGLGKLDDRATLMNSMFDREHEIMQDESPKTYGTTDFIHANYVRGGPLLNTFICAQAPLDNTQEDFWRMVYQERSQMIIMLNAAVDSKITGPLDSAIRSHCPYYWPRAENEEMTFGSLRITCIYVDAKADPLFTVTKLKVAKINGVDDDDDDDDLIVEHWHWDWQYLGDVHWPFRVLRKARLQKSPTIVMCQDGCGKAGTLVAIEAALMHFLRGSPQSSSVILQACTFVRLQRRLSVSSALHFMFIYRVLLRFVEPYVATFYQRTALGLRFKSVGFVPKFNSMIQEFSRITPAY